MKTIGSDWENAAKPSSRTLIISAGSSIWFSPIIPHVFNIGPFKCQALMGHPNSRRVGEEMFGQGGSGCDLMRWNCLLISQFFRLLIIVLVLTANTWPVIWKSLFFQNEKSGWWEREIRLKIMVHLGKYVWMSHLFINTSYTKQFYNLNCIQLTQF